MNALKNAVWSSPRGLVHAAAVLAMGCSAGAGDSSPSAEGAPSEITQELRLAAHPAPGKSHHPAPPPRNPGHGHGRGSGGACNPQTPGGGASGSAGSAGSNATGGGFNSGAGGSSSGGPGGDSGGASEGGVTSSGGASDGGFTSSGGAPEGGVTSTGGAGGVGGGLVDPCGDGVQIFNACDDGNTTPGDGCSATCEVEPGYACRTPGAPCQQQRCGDGFQDAIFTPGDPAAAGGAGGELGAGGAAGAPGTYTFEGCDDGNTVSGDGCSATCDVEAGFLCPTPGTLCHEPRCGDGLQDFITTGDGATGGAANGAGGTGAGGAFPGAGGAAGGGGSGFFEGCDDGNTASGDGCSASCDVEDGFVCEQPNTPCRQPRCGDGVVDFSYPGTEPSAGGAPSGGAASAGGASTGGVSTGGLGAGGASAGGDFSAGGAAGAGSVEQCDDGNTTSGDGCSAACQVE